ncbi:ATP-binding cassette sub-family C member 4 [Diabrotica virgifera virgifera]|uniref:Multidrug resistance-associated protein 4-like n=1 Tax=Diabrotica virgifera virgifera TaxID=50390 RepID=A0A6P7FGE0_DIAVI|nr:ATP-binding cassette sub-family C member 4 [Diabrotica virgifera virgifera]XP_028134950.1 ATP-binding cassette sub-family C member 4 [Diabrotica virgifera virgifera]XP_028134951.1 ATP-binding cassette sub-family C member 4 [Diabrotica virgifera virgifera]XP_028134952.1 ATP-binding cassette sub-family C member 4 [Diabrotica virgifera virgifera]XP_050511830.1 ATP-binding cassette sub-family C member 4 [Diabrotica virgifera virgifera]KAI2474047.1 ATP binding cassette (ABC) transporter subfamil
MEMTKEKYNPNPRETANIISALFFGYTYDVFKKGLSKTLEVDDLYNPLKSDRSKVLGDNLQRNWDKQLEKSKKSNSKPSLLKAIVMSFWLEYAKLGIYTITTDLVLRLIQPLILGNLLDYFKPESQVSENEALTYAGILVAINILNILMSNQYMLEVFHSGMRIRASCCAVIYRKSLKLSKTALGETASGKLVNLLSNDVSRFDIVSLFIHQLWMAPVLSLIVMGILYQRTGYAGVVGVVAVFVIVPFQTYTGKLSAIYRKQTAFKTDERVRLMDEIISGIQVIKMYAWEIPFRKIIRIARRNEIKIITKSAYVRATFMALNLFTTRLALFCTLLTVILSNEEITASKVFVVMGYFNVLSMAMSTMFSRGVSEMAEVMVAIRRIRDFLINEEYDPNRTNFAMNGNVNSVDDFKEIISLQNLTVKWNASFSDNALENININISDGQMVGIIGPVGSGKSSLLQTLLGELDITEGSMRVRGQISYASQEPWVFASTVRQNILFGEEYDKKRYHEVIEACSLEKDFEQFPNGDLTLVGDRGSSLSGGQKARINLARAVYREADVYLLDDPLSAVDIHVSKHLYEKCINGYLANRTRILVTHQVHYLKDADNIIILNNGRIEDEGTFNFLANSDNVYAKLLTAEPENVEEKKQDRSKYNRQLSIRSRKDSLASIVSELSIADTLISNDIDFEEEEAEKQLEFDVKDLQEQSSKGKVGGSLLFKYMLAGSNSFAVLICVILYLGTQLAASGVDYWVSYWVNVEEFRSSSESSNSTTPTFIIPSIELTTNNCLYIYGFLLGALFVLAMTRSFFFYKLAMWSSKKLHATIFDNIVTATMRFFDTNPGGRILNRFSKDMGCVDELLPKAILDSSQMLLSMCGSLLLIVVVNPYFLILIGALSVVFGFMRHVYLKSSKNIKRLEGIMRSPVFTHLRATIEGLTTIRAFGAQSTLMDEFDHHQDYHSGAWYMFIVSSNAFGFYLDCFCSLFLAALTFSLLLFGEAFNLKGGQVGLAITQATALTSLLQWGMRQSAEVTNQLMSVERVLEYQNLEKEPQPVVPQKPAKEWPQKGEITFKDTCLKYFEGGPLVLKHLDLKIQPKEKVGVVGRTGAGKSSLIQALFRLAPIEGSIKIDDIDTKDISLNDLRLKISIIPQDPVLFSGTLRYNLDPFEEYSDEVLYKAIQDVELKDPANVINRLENRVMDRGSNYSVGQRQLICLARAILKNNKVLMLDEATANVDPQTDALIQKTIRRKFSDCTVITVAHRLNTIMDSDKVLVMDAGQISEFDHPHLLLQNKNGVFYSMVAETGRTTAEQLRKIASDSYQKLNALPE